MSSRTKPRTTPWTPAELAQIEAARQAWLAVGRSTERADIPRLQAAWAALYRRAKRDPVFVWVTDGPMSAHAALAIWSRASLDASLRDSLDASLDASLRASLGAYQWTWWWGAHDAYWVSWYRTAQALGVPFTSDQDARLTDIEETVRAGLWAWPHEHGVVVCDRPTVCRMEDLAGDGYWRLHAPDGPAMAWLDGWQIHAWHGVRVPADVIERPETITAKRITAETNQEVRRAMVERIGWDRYLEMARAVPVQSDRYGDLYRLTIGEADVTIVLVQNSTPEPDGQVKRYGLTVPETCRTAHEAVASTFGLTADTYRPSLET